MRYTVYLAVAAFLVPLLVSTIIVQASAGTLTETRRSAILNSLSKENVDAPSTAQMLLTLETLDGLKSVNLEQRLNHLVSEQTVTSANGTLWNWPEQVGGFGNVSYVNEMYRPYLVTTVLRHFGAESQLNQTALLNLVMERYNETDGAFDELAFEFHEGGRGEIPYALCTFPLFEDWGNQALDNGGWAESNMISTFLAVSILDNLDSLNRINVTKTLNWVLSCKADNGAFRPTPGDYWYNGERGWPLDTYNGTGIGYTYAALSALKILGANVEDVVNIEMLRKYIMSCRETFPNGEVEFGTPYYNLASEEKIAGDFYTTYYAIMLLHQIGALENETATVSGVVAYIKSLQDNVFNQFTNSWPLPHGDSSYGPPYGLINYAFYPDDYFASSILNVTNSLNVLDSATPIASRTLINLLSLSFAVSVPTFGLSIVGMLAYDWIRGWKQKKKTLLPSPP